jgi:hypothetical protein
LDYRELQKKEDRRNPAKEYILSKQEPLFLTQELDSKDYEKLFHYLLERGIYLPPLQ